MVKPVYKFGPFSVDHQTRLLFRDGERVSLPPKAADILVALLERNSELVTKEELLKQVWPDTFVEEGNFSKHIYLLRRILGENEDGTPFIETVPKRGYRFLGCAQPSNPGAVTFVTEEGTTERMVIEELETIDAPARRLTSIFSITMAAGAFLLFLAAGVTFYALPLQRTQTLKSLAILPLRSLDHEAKDDHLELGMADAIIGKVSQIQGLTVRPTSAVRPFSGPDVDALDAARRLHVDAVLDGTVQRSGDRLRVRANLIRVSDGVSLWSENFDVRFRDIFSIQDEVSRQVASRLRSNLTSDEQSQLGKRATANPAAYDYYLAGLRHFDERSLTKMGPAIQAFQKAVELDPNYALAHARLAYAYAWMALFIEPRNTSWLPKARLELERAEKLDPNLPETHVVRYQLLWSVNEGFRIGEAIREIRRAQALRPEFSGDVGVLAAHLGLEPQSLRELRRSIEQDPLSSYNKGQLVEAHEDLGLFEEALSVGFRFGFNKPQVRSLLALGRLDQAEPLIRAQLTENPKAPRIRGHWVLLLALRGRFSEAEAEIPKIKDGWKDRGYHHAAETVACVYALQGKAREAVQWLRTTADTGMPNYTLFQRDPHLARIRSTPEFVQFMAELKPRWEAMEREFL